jgi:tetratricopeptide (TPR) repeat protein
MFRFFRVFFPLICVVLVSSSVFSQELSDSLTRLMEKARGVEKVRLLNELSAAVLRQSPAQSIVYAQQALDLAVKTKKVDQQAVALNNLGKAYYLQGEYARAENFYKESVYIAEKNNDRLNAAKGYNNLGVLYRSQGDYDRALEYYNKALVTSRALNDLQGIARGLNNIGEIYKYRGDYANAMLNYEESYKIKKELGDIAGMANTLNNLGEIYNYWGDFQKSLQYYQESYTQRSGLNDRQGMATSIYNIGMIYADLDNSEQALKYISESLRLYEEIGDKSGMSYCLDKIGEIYRERGQYDLANENFNRSLKLQEDLGNNQGKAASLRNLAEVLLEKRQFEQAAGFYEQALKIYKGAGNQKEIAETFNQVGRLYSSSGNNSLAIDYFLRAKEIASDLNLLGIIRDCYSGLSDAYGNQGQFGEALEYYKKFITLKDSIGNETVRKNINELETRYQTEKKEREIELKNAQLARQEAEIRQKNLQQYGLMVLVLLVISTAVAFYRGYRNKQKANVILSRQKAEIEIKNLEITDSIRYAKHIQNAILPHISYVTSSLPEAFVFYRPKAIVSGDFYWVEKLNGSVYVAAVDSTGHGVPGAFISLLGFNILNTAIKEKDDLSPSGILNSLNRMFSERLSKSHPDEHIKDSMEIALCQIDSELKHLQFSGAYSPLWIIRDKQLIETRPDKFPIGTYFQNPDRKYTNHHHELHKGDLIYLFSDGYADQFGGPEGKKFRYNQLRDLLINSCHQSMEVQKQLLEDTMNTWMGSEEQVDDMLIIGMRV